MGHSGISCAAIWPGTWELRGCARVDSAQIRSRIRVRIAPINKHNKERAMMDVLMVALALLLFAAAIGYTYACERL
jgi:hypothetical protein